jgi:hypothetical protein
MLRPSGMTGPNKTTIVCNVTYNAMNQMLSMDYPDSDETGSSSLGRS